MKAFRWTLLLGVSSLLLLLLTCEPRNNGPFLSEGPPKPAVIEEGWQGNVVKFATPRQSDGDTTFLVSTALVYIGMTFGLVLFVHWVRNVKRRPPALSIRFREKSKPRQPCPWEPIWGFHGWREFYHFEDWLQEQLNAGIAREVPMLQPEGCGMDHMEKWFVHKPSSEVWRLVWPDPPAAGHFDRVDEPHYLCGRRFDPD